MTGRSQRVSRPQLVGLEKEQECRFIRLLPNGTPLVQIQGREFQFEIDGVVVPQPPPSLYCQIFNERLPRLRKTLRCIVHTVGQEGRVRGRLYCYGWHDKSGDVWLDVAIILLDEGVATVDEQRDFPGKQEYLRRQRHAHESQSKEAQ